MSSTKNRSRFGAVLFSLALVAGACGGGGGNDKKATDLADDATTTTLGGSDSTLDAGSSTTGANGVSGTTSTTKKAGTSATTAKPLGAAPTAPPAADPNAVPGPAKTGTYGYSQSGSSPDGPVPPHGTLVVEGGTTQSFKRYYDPNKPPLVLTYVFRDTGPYIVGATMSAKGATVTCTFGNGVPVPPWPPTPGKTFSGNGTCSSPVGPLTASINGSVTSRNGDLVGIATTVHANNASNNVSVTLHDTESWSISLRVPKTSHQTFEGTAFGQPISGDITSTLTSTP